MSTVEDSNIGDHVFTSRSQISLYMVFIK